MTTRTWTSGAQALVDGQPLGVALLVVLAALLVGTAAARSAAPLREPLPDMPAPAR